VVRRAFHDDTWIAALENRLRNQQDHVVISDCRFPNEIAAIKRAGGIVVRVTRGPEPSWYYLAEMSNRGLTVFQDELKSVGIHASETAWIGTDFDAILDNNAGMDHLYAQVNNLVQDPQLATADLNAVPLQHSSNI
jgi:hypothetical protein